MLMELGRLTYDVEVRDVGEDKKVLNNRIAIQAGKDSTTFVDIVAWNGVAEHIGKYFKKGFEILVQGHLVNTNRMKDNVEYDSVAILVEKVFFTNGNPRAIDVPDFL
jgi:single-stranded DNA-binding protein